MNHVLQAPGAALAACLAATAFAAVPNNPNDPVLSADSDFVRAIYAQPAADLRAVLVAREAATIAGDKVAADRLHAHAEDLGLSKLAGRAPPGVATLRDVVEGRAPSVDRDILRAELLATTLRLRLAHRPDGYALFPARDPSMFLDYSYEGQSVWSSRDRTSGRPYWVYLRVEIENVGANDVTQFDSRLSVSLEDGKAVTLECRANPWFDRLPPGASAQHVCSTEAHRVAAAQLVAAAGAIDADPSRWKLQPLRINFADPAISLNRRSVFWHDGSRARQEIVAQIKAASCFERNSCLDELKFKVKFDPAWAIGVPSVALGLVLGVVFAFFGRRRWLAARVASALSIAAFLVAAGAAAVTGMIAAMVIGIAGAIGLAVFNAVLWGTLALLSAFRREPVQVAP